MNMKENNVEPTDELHENHRHGSHKTAPSSIPINALRNTMRALAVSAALMGTGAAVASMEGCTEVSHIIDAVVAVRELSFVNDYFKENKDALKKTSLKEILGHPDVVQSRFREAKTQVLIAQKGVRALLAVGVQLNPNDVAELERLLNTMSNLQNFAGNGFVIGLAQLARDEIPESLRNSADAVIAIQEFFFELKQLKAELKASIKRTPVRLSDEDRNSQTTRFANIRAMYAELRECNADKRCRKERTQLRGMDEAIELALCLREGDRGEYVQRLQSFLRRPIFGFGGGKDVALYDGSIDGVYGEDTKEAVKKLSKGMDANMPNPNCEKPL